MVLIELHLAPGVTTITLSEEMVHETGARALTSTEVRAGGHSGELPPAPEGMEQRFITVEERDARWVLNALEAEPNVTSFRVLTAA